MPSSVWSKISVEIKVSIKQEQPKVLWRKVLDTGGGEMAYSVISAMEEDVEHVYIFGVNASLLGKQFWILKIFDNGTIEYNITYPEKPQTEIFPYKILVGPDGYVYAVGQIGYTNVTVLKIAPNGTYDVIFNQQLSPNLVGLGPKYGGAYITEDGIYIVCTAAALINESTLNDILIMKLSLNGTVLWKQAIGTMESDYGFSIYVDSKGIIYIGGVHGSNSSVYIFDPSVNESYYGLWETNVTNYAYVMDVDEHGYEYLLGEVAGRPLFLKFYRDIFQISVQLSNTSSGRIYDAYLHGFHIYATGYIEGMTTEEKDIILYRVSKLGEVLWNTTFAGNSTDIGYGICIGAREDSIYIVGLTKSFGDSNGDMIILKYNIPTATPVKERIKGGGGYILGIISIIIIFCVAPIIIAIVTYRHSKKL